MTRARLGLVGLAIATLGLLAAAPVVRRASSVPSLGDNGRVAMRVGAHGVETRLRGVTRWPARTVIEVRGTVHVEAGATLEIGAGAFVAMADSAAVIVDRDARIDARGTLLQSIVFSCATPVATPGCWRGLFVYGHAPINHGATLSPPSVRGGSGGCRQAAFDGETYGGCSTADSSGVLQFVRVQYAVDGLRLFGVGDRTVVRSVQVHRSQGNGVTVVGGTVGLRDVVATTNAQYGLAWAGGWRGRAQSLLIQQDGAGHAGGLLGRNAFAASDDPNASPRSEPALANVSIIAPVEALNPYAATEPAAIRLERGTAVDLRNVVVVQARTVLDVDDDATCVIGNAGGLFVRGLVSILPERLLDPDVDPPVCGASGAESVVLAGTDAFTVTDVTTGLAEFIAPTNLVLADIRPRGASLTAGRTPAALRFDSFFEPLPYVGAVPPANVTRTNIPWYSGWTLGEVLPAPGPGRIVGRVLAIGRGGIAGAQVLTLPSGRSTTANAVGGFRLEQVTGGPVEVVASSIPVECLPKASAFARVRASLGPADSTDVTVLVGCPGAPPTASLAAGFLHTCGRSSDGTARCWGRNAGGQIGDGTTTARNVPTAAATATRFRQLAGGAGHTCGLDALGAAWCWGDNFAGQLGDLSLTRRTTPVSVSTSQRFVQVVAGSAHSCGLTAEGAAWCWGGNANGELGDGTITQRTAPVAVLPPAGATDPLVFVRLAGGTSHTCGLTATARLYCWGDNAAGQLGNGTTADAMRPVAAVGPQAAVVDVAAGALHTCAIVEDASARCWGFNADGQLGDGTRATRLTPTLVAGALAFTRLAAGGSHTCAISTGGLVWCWGQGDLGQLGIGPTDDLDVPAQVTGLVGAQTIVSGLSHTCVDSAGQIVCWGSNLDGQLGDGTFTSRDVPAPISGGTLGAASLLLPRVGSGAASAVADAAPRRQQIRGN